MAGQKTIEGEVAALGDLTLPELRGRWQQLYGTPPPRSLRRAFLVKACAYKIQEKACGGLSGRTRRKLRKIADDISVGKAISIAPTRRIKPGTRLVRAWDGTVHTVTVIAGGFEYAGARYGSLSAIAKAITGSIWNGPAFFGLEAPTRGAQSADNARTGTRGDGDGGSGAHTGPVARLKELEDVDYE